MTSVRVQIAHSSPSMVDTRRVRLLWCALLVGTSSLFVLALLPPFLPVEMQSVVRQCFASVCHQWPSRSPQIGGVPIALCDRCSGVYLGLVGGVAATGWGRFPWRTLGGHGRYLLLGAVVPLGLNWIGPVLGLWGNGPLSRALTGLLFGGVAASYVANRLLQRVTRTASAQGPEHR